MGFLDDLLNVTRQVPVVGAVQSAAEGRPIDEIAAGILPGGSAVYGGLKGELTKNIENKASERLQQLMQQSAQDYSDYRPQQAQAYTNALGTNLSAYDPYNDYLTAMYGPGARMDFNKLTQNPFPYGHPANPAAPAGPTVGPSDPFPPPYKSQSGAVMESSHNPYEFVSDTNPNPPGPYAGVPAGTNFDNAQARPGYAPPQAPPQAPPPQGGGNRSKYDIFQQPPGWVPPKGPGGS
jgi:hypothetical protein